MYKCIINIILEKTKVKLATTCRIKAVHVSQNKSISRPSFIR